ncbi:hypothetical protein [Oceanithermus sp.]
MDEAGPDGGLRRHTLDRRHFARCEVERRLAAAGLFGRPAGGLPGAPFDANRPATVGTARRVS